MGQNQSLDSEQQRQSDDRYSVHLNGGSSAPPWPVSNAQSGKMFAVPTQLKEDDEIVIRGFMIDGLLDIALQLDTNQYNVASQINVVYPDNQPHNQIILRNVQNGTSNTIGEFKATDYFPDTNFDVRFIITPNAIRITVGESYLESTPLEHNASDIRYISVRGQVKQLNFSFNAY